MTEVAWVIVVAALAGAGGALGAYIAGLQGRDSARAEAWERGYKEGAADGRYAAVMAAQDITIDEERQPRASEWGNIVRGSLGRRYLRDRSNPYAMPRPMRHRARTRRRRTVSPTPPQQG